MGAPGSKPTNSLERDLPNALEAEAVLSELSDLLEQAIRNALERWDMAEACKNGAEDEVAEELMAEAYEILRSHIDAMEGSKLP